MRISPIPYSVLLASLILLLFVTCKMDSETSMDPEPSLTVRGVDLSFLPTIESSGTLLYDDEGVVVDPLEFMLASGVNTVRLRLWVDPVSEASSLSEVASLASRVESMGADVWLCIHYSDTWADPEHQETPSAWQGLNFEVLKDSMLAYTSRVMQVIQPSYVQIGNETNDGLLFPQGKLSTSPEQSVELFSSAASLIREEHPDTRIMLHHAGYDGAQWFFDHMGEVDFDILGLSFYPMWHGKSLDSLGMAITALSSAYDKDVLIMETAYPFTLDWADWTDNVLGLEDQLILPEYPATPQGQYHFLQDLKHILLAQERALGFCYWAPDQVAFDGPQSTTGSPWENQALYDFGHSALPAWEVFTP